MEYENNYEETISKLKASVFDVVDIEKKNTDKLEEQLKTESDQEKIKDIQEEIDLREDKIDEVIDSTDQILEDIKLLKSMSLVNGIKVSAISKKDEEVKTEEKEEEKQEEEEIDIFSQALKTEKQDEEKEEEQTEEVEEENVNIFNQMLKENDSNEESEEKETEEKEEETETEEKEESEESTEESEEKEEEETETEEKEESKESTEESEEKEEEETEIENEEPELEQVVPTEEPEENTEQADKNILYAFNKEDKLAPRAIMTKDDQYEKLEKSLEKQTEKVQSLGLFQGYDYESSTKNTIQGDVIDQSIEEELNLYAPSDLSIERQIEDLTVKASIYDGEGEPEKVAAINKRIGELKEELKGQSEEKEKMPTK